MNYNSLNEMFAHWHQQTRFAVKIPLDVEGGWIDAYSYLRFSTPEQAEGDSTRRQTDLRDAWLKRHPKVRLDTSLTLQDKGVSGFKGAHRKDKRHALARFLDLVERGRVRPGSYLIVENLDRLTREEPEESIPLVLNLIRAGVRIVQLLPSEMVYESGMDFGRLMSMLWELARGHGESKTKSSRCGEAWTAKKEQARAERRPHGKAVPAWMELSEGAYRLREDKAKAVRRIFTLSAHGLGTLAIARRLNKEGVPTIARADRWVRSYVAKILNNRAVLGEYQPRRGRRGREPDGEPVPQYFPAVVTEAEWHAAHNAKDGRNRRSGRPTRKGDYVYPFSGLVYCALDRCPMHVVMKRGIRMIVSSKANGGEPGSHWRHFPVEVFSRAILSELQELEGRDLFADPGAGRVAEVEGKLGEVERRLKVALQRFDADPESPTWADQVSQYDKEKRALLAELKEAQREAASPLSSTWAEAVELMAAEEPERLRAALLATIEGVWCVVVKRGRVRLCEAEVVFKGGPVRDYLLIWRPAMGGAVPKAAAQVYVGSSYNKVPTVPYGGPVGPCGWAREPEMVAEVERILREEFTDDVIETFLARA